MSDQEIKQANRKFFDIVEDLAVYQETLEFIEEKMFAARLEGDERSELMAQHRECAAKRETIGLELVAKVDGIAAVDRRFDAEILLAQEAERSAAKHRRALESSKAWLRDYVLHVMEARGLKHLRTPVTTVVASGNGGQLPVIIDDLSQLPQHLAWLVGKIREDVFQDFCRRVFGIAGPLLDERWRFAREPNSGAVLKALQEPCPMCKGEGNLADQTESVCPDCHGSKLARVPGARLGVRGRHLRIT